MKPSDILKLHRAEIRQIVAECHATNARVFGSTIHGDDTENSDLDLLVDVTSNTTLFDIARIQRRLQQILSIPVDVLTPNSLPKKFRLQVLNEAVPV